MRTSIITRTVWLLSFVSLLNDIASEMLYPVMPLYLQSIGFGIVGIGILEGIAEATAGLSKGWFGQWSDVRGERLPFVRWGYLISALAKPLTVVWAMPLWVFFTRSLDKLGKGIRTGARDALLSGEATKETKASVFGFHRGMDTMGAAIGPFLALLFLWQFPGAYKTLFLIAIMPGAAAVISTLLLKEKKGTMPSAGRGKLPGFFSFLKYLPQSSPAYRRLLAGLLAFALVNSSDLFLLLMLKERGLSDTMLIGVYIFYNLVYALAAYPIGSLADRWGLKRTFTFGLLLFAGVYGGMALGSEWWHFGALFFGYGIYSACTEGVAKAWISNVVEPQEVGTAIGAYEGLRNIAAMLANTLAGLIWYQFSPQALFGTTAAAAVLIAAYFSRRYFWKN